MSGRGSKFSRAIKGARWEATRRRVFDRDGWRCTRCGKASRLECHHVRARHLGGDAFNLANLATYCRDCHIDTHRPPVDPERAAWSDFLKTFQPSEGG